MKKITFVIAAIGLHFASYGQQQVEWACKVVETNDPNKDTYAPEQLLNIPDAYPSGQKDNGFTYCVGFTYEKTKPATFPMVKVKLEYCKPIIAEQVAIVETYLPGTITKVTIEDTKGKSKIVYTGKATAAKEESRIFYVKFTRTTDPIKYVTIEAKPGDIPGVNCIDAVGLVGDKNPVNAAINLGSDIQFISEATPVEGFVNSVYNEVLPVISPGGDLLMFDRKDDPQNVMDSTKSTDNHDDIYFSRKGADGKWLPPTHKNKPLNNWSHNFVNSVSPDGTTLLLANTYLADGEPGGAGASVTRRKKGGGWEVPKALKITEFNNDNAYVSFSMSNNNKILLMAIQDKDSYGEKDVYVSFLQADGETWSKPMNIGNAINTRLDEYSPVLASDNVTMYFASKGHYGYGGYDIYVTKRLDDTWKKWSTPVNLGTKINSAKNEMGFSIVASGKEVYTYRYRNENKQCDIYVIQTGQAESIKPEAVYLISGRVFDAKTKKPIHADIQYELLSTGANAGYAGSDPDNGEYKIVLPLGNTYGYFAKADGYFAIHESLEIPDSASFTEVQRDLYLVPIETGQTIKMNNVFFVQSQAVLLPTSYPELDRMAEVLINNPKIEIRLDGHTDNQGDANKNIELSQQRVDVVKKYLVGKGVQERRITTKAFGGAKPIASNAKEETRKLNRRVEFTIMKK